MLKDVFLDEPDLGKAISRSGRFEQDVMQVHYASNRVRPTLPFVIIPGSYDEIGCIRIVC
jgi:hypothetical protein